MIYRSDGSVCASLCCKKSALAQEALREEELAWRTAGGADIAIGSVSMLRWR